MNAHVLTTGDLLVIVLWFVATWGALCAAIALREWADR